MKLRSLITDKRTNYIGEEATKAMRRRLIIAFVIVILGIGGYFIWKNL